MYRGRTLIEQSAQTLAEALRREQRMTLLLRQLMRGTTEVGESFFCSLANSLTAALGVRFSFIAVREGDWTRGAPMVRLLAFFEHGEMLPTFCYDTRGTPCAGVIDGGAVRIADDAFAHYPDDAWFSEAGIRGYQAVPIMIGDTVEGLLGIADDKALEPNELLDEVLSACAGRCAAELDRVRLTEEARRLEEQYRRAQKMEAIGRFAGGVAHDFNNMLTVISIDAELVLTDMSADHPYRESIEEIMSAAMRSAELTRQLLAFSRKEVFKPRPLDLRELVDGIRTIVQRMVGEEIVIDIVHAPELGSVRVDAGQLEQVLFNLATNASDAMCGGGRLTIETANIGELVGLSVTDTGCGMSAELREHIFEPFFTTKSVGRGTGLGLAMVYGFVEQNGGRIDVRSEPGRGSRFELWFPRVRDEPEPQVIPDEAACAPGHETILIAEDEELVRGVAVRILERLGYDVLEAASGPEALARAEAHPGTIDLLVTDVVMPLMNGSELAEQLHARDPELAVLYCSGYSDNVIAQRGVHVADIQLLSKPYSSVALAKRVREVLDARSSR